MSKEGMNPYLLTYSEICGDHCELVLWGVGLHLECPLVLDMERLQRDVGFLIGCSYATISVHGDNPTIKHIYILYTGDLIEHGCKQNTVESYKNNWGRRGRISWIVINFS